MGVAERLAERGLEIPPAQVIPPGVRLTYRRLVRSENVAYIAGHGPTHGEGWGSPLGKVGREVTVDEAVARGGADGAQRARDDRAGARRPRRRSRAG